MIERIRLGCEATLKCHSESWRKFTQSDHSITYGYVATLGKLREKSSVLSRRLKVDRELDDWKEMKEASETFKLALNSLGE